MKLKYIYGRLIAYVPTPGMMEDGSVAEFFPCEGESFDLIFFDPSFKNLKQALLHETLHAVLHRLCIGQTELSLDLEELIIEGISVYITENYTLREK